LLQAIASTFAIKDLHIFLLYYIQSDYLRKISLKMLSMETKTQQGPGNAQVIPNQNNPGQGTRYSKLSVARFIIFAFGYNYYSLRSEL
jgi:PAX-interacting protein 1